MTDRELMRKALENLEDVFGENRKDVEIVKALRERLAHPNEFKPDWDAMAVMVEEQQRMAKRIEELEAQPQRKPLTNEQLKPLIQKAMVYYGHNPDHWLLTSGAGFCILARAIEAAHGIKS